MLTQKINNKSDITEVLCTILTLFLRTKFILQGSAGGIKSHVCGGSAWHLGCTSRHVSTSSEHVGVGTTLVETSHSA